MFSECKEECNIFKNTSIFNICSPHRGPVSPYYTKILNIDMSIQSITECLLGMEGTCLIGREDKSPLHNGILEDVLLKEYK